MESSNRCRWESEALYYKEKCELLEREIADQKALTQEYKDLCEALKKVNRELIKQKEEEGK
jgi:hypothetical protein